MSEEKTHVFLKTAGLRGCCVMAVRLWGAGKVEGDTLRCTVCGQVFQSQYHSYETREGLLWLPIESEAKNDRCN